MLFSLLMDVKVFELILLFAVKKKNSVFAGQLKAERFEEVDEQINNLCKLVQRFEEMRISSMEYAYLKLISFTANG